jgi:hypothetical protein
VFIIAMTDQPATNPAFHPVNATIFLGGGGGEIKRGDLAAKHSLLSNAAVSKKWSSSRRHS